MKKRSLMIAVFAMIAAAALMLAGCGDSSSESAGANTFEPDLAGTELLVYMIKADDSYIGSTEYVFSEDRVKFLTLDSKYNLYTGEEAYEEALITEEEANAMYTENSFGGDEKGGFITIIMPCENGGKAGLYGWMNMSMDKMELTDPYDGTRLFFFRKDSDAAASYEKDLEPYFDSFMKEFFGDEYEVTYADRTLVLSNPLDGHENATEEAVKSGKVIDVLALASKAAQSSATFSPVSELVSTSGAYGRKSKSFSSASNKKSAAVRFPTFSSP